MLAELENLESNYPFNDYEYILSHLLSYDKLSLENYKDIRNSYNNDNPYLFLFSMSGPREFGEKWAQTHIMDLEQRFKKPTKDFHKEYVGDYDLWLPFRSSGIRIEVKASRAVDADKRDVSLLEKALATYSQNDFDMNFQQIKPAHCDVFIWIAAWTNELRYWVLNSREVEQNKFYSKGQHRGNQGEGQLHINKRNIKKFDQYKCNKYDLYRCVVESFNRAT